MSNINSMMRRRQRVRTKLALRRNGRARLSIHRTGRHIYAQIIDDLRGHTVAAASTLQDGLVVEGKTGGNTEAAKAVGHAIAQRALAAGVSQVVFDRGGYLFHGRIKALADAAREAGLQF